jgi:lipopolysaccharide biosynthesis glycosyltransferase
MLSSLLAHNEPKRIHCHLLSDGIRIKDIERIRRMMANAGACLDVYDVQDRLSQNSEIFSGVGYYSRAAFGRLLIPEVVSECVGRMIYFDCDIICISDLSELWSHVQLTKIIGAARDEWVDRDEIYKLRIGMSPGAHYYNTGVLTINLEEWRARDLSTQILGVLRSMRRAKYADQDAINLLVSDEITELPAKWNTLITSPRSSDARQDLSCAAAVHFCGGFKPWQVGYGLSGGWGSEIFRQAKSASPWKRTLPDFHVARIKRKVRDAFKAPHPLEP